MTFPMLRRLILTVCLLAFAAPLSAEDAKVPFWSSVKAERVNMRVGPGEAYRIDWVYRRPLLPLKVLRVMEGWWLVQDPDGAKGWVLASLMSKRRGAMVQGPGLADMRESGDPSARLMWRLEPGVTGKLGDCDGAWCELELGEGRKGWVEQSRLWGADGG